jgi:dynein heavy chain
LYVPQEAGLENPAKAARQREIVQRMEVQVLRWTQHVRGLLTQRGRGQRGGHLDGPAEEVAFWRQRRQDLGSLRGQLESEQLGAVLRVLEAARSPHLPAFLCLRGEITAEADKAASNLAFLEAVEKPCAALASADMGRLVALLPAVLDACRMVWTLSPHYSTPDHMANLLRLVGNAIVARCRSVISLDQILAGQELGAAMETLQQCCGTIAAARAACEEAVQRMSAALPGRPWACDGAAIFAHMEAFAQRCRDLREVCMAQRQFACEEELAAVLGGGRASEASQALGEMRQAFAQQMRR